jgi:hypothetical protein
MAMARKSSEGEGKTLGTDHHGNPVHETLTDHEGNVVHGDREELGKDDYGRPYFTGQVAIRDAHGNTVYQEPWHGKGPKAGPDNVHGK